MDSETLDNIKAQVLAALRHPEADERLYFRNFTILHEEDERPRVVADEVDILDALHALIEEGKVQLDESQQEAVFQLIETD